MAPASKLAATKSQAQKAVKEKVLHPRSRKAAQLERAALRKDKLAGQSSARSKQQIVKGIGISQCTTASLLIYRIFFRGPDWFLLSGPATGCIIPQSRGTS